MNIHRTHAHRTQLFIFLTILLCILGTFIYIFMPQQHESHSNRPTNAVKKTTLSPSIESTSPFKKDLYSIDTQGSIWWIVNKNRPVGETYVPPHLVTPPVTLNPTKSDAENTIRADVAPHMKDLFASAASAGHTLFLASGYRSYALQNTYYSNYVAKSGQAEADRFSARPGTSEHQTGLSFDVATADRQHYLDQSFGEQEAGKWLAAHAHEFGFIIRYPKDKESITGYMYEPWHLRYVGTELSGELYRTQQTMEEFFGLSS